MKKEFYMSASKKFRTATLDMLRKMIKDPEYTIEKKTVRDRREYSTTREVISYSFVSEQGKRIWRIRKGNKESSHPYDITIGDKSLWGEFLDSEVESLYNDVRKEFIKRKLNPFSKNVKGELLDDTPKKKEEKPTLGKETENKIVHFLKQYVK